MQPVRSPSLLVRGGRPLSAMLACLCVLAIGLISGCARRAGEGLVVASAWTEAERSRLEADFLAWAEERPAEAIGAGPIVWVGLRPDDDPERVAGRAPDVDVLLGGPAASYRRLAERGALAPADAPETPRWVVARRGNIGLAVSQGSPAATDVRVAAADLGLASPALRGLVAIDDPRRDPLSRAFLHARLAAAGNDWPRAYADLVRAAGNARPAGWRRGSALASLERGEALVAPALLEPGQDVEAGGVLLLPLADAPAWVEGAAVLRTARHAEAAQTFLRFVAERSAGGSTPPGEVARRDPEAADADDPRLSGLLADLLGATLVDAQDDLIAARVALTRFDRKARAERDAFLTQAPPWPPASVTQLRQSSQDGAWVETLAEQLAPDAEARAWLLQQWKAPPRPIEGATLRELASAARGRLADEPRFRAWLKAEWTAWARQRYRAARGPAAEGRRS